MSSAEVRLLAFFKQGADAGLRLFQFLRYAIEVHGIARILTRVGDGRRDPDIPTFSVLTSLLMAAVMRVPSLNQLELLLRRGSFQRLLGERTQRYRNKPLFSADTIVDVLDGLETSALEAALVEIVKKAERNKAFRDDTFGTFICAAIDGWEPFCSYQRHCAGCLTRQVQRQVKIDAAIAGEVELDEEDLENDSKEKVTQYYHRFVVAFLVAPKLDLTLAIEPIRTEAQRVADGEKPGCGDEGEITAALRLLDRLHDTYGCFIDAFALDGLYPCGPIFEKLTAYHYGAVIVTRDKRKDPYRFADGIWQTRTQPDLEAQDPETGDGVAFYRLDGVDALSSFAGSVDMLKAVVTRKPRPQRDPNKKPKNTRGRNINIPRPDRGPTTTTWVMVLVGKATRLNNLVALRIMRARWHIENTAFHQWVTQWNFDHCYRHTPNAVNAVMNVWAIAFNLMQLFFYRRLNKPRRGRPVNDTVVGCVKSMSIDLGEILDPVPWDLFPTDTG